MGKKSSPYLEYYPKPGAPLRRIKLDPLPFRIGRGPAADYTLDSPRVSTDHAEIWLNGETFCIRDLNSRNGTFVNVRRITESPLEHGDIVHFADQEFGFGHDRKLIGLDRRPSRVVLETMPLESHFVRPPASQIRSGQHLQELVAEQRIRAEFQPIVGLSNGNVLGFEALGRGAHPEIPIKPDDLLALADQHGRAAELSALFRANALQEASSLPPSSLLFLNVHPAELELPSLAEHLIDEIHAVERSYRVVMEVHEEQVVDLSVISSFRKKLLDAGIGLAYDDFGAGRNRLVELTEAPPDYIKLDASLVRNLDKSEKRQDLIRALVGVMNEFSIEVIGEAIETEAEAELCRTLGCHYGQGFWHSHPQPVSCFSKPSGKGQDEIESDTTMNRP